MLVKKIIFLRRQSPVLVHLKLNKISSLLIISEFDELLSEINLFLKIITTEMFANEFESTLVTDLLMDLNNPESRLENSNSIINLESLYLIYLLGTKI